jgi:putative N6-adenine-specific DNA methylase
LLQSTNLLLNLFSIFSRIIITCSNRLSPWLQKEVESLGYTPVKVFKTGVELMGNMQDCIRLNLHLRCASQVLFSIKELEAYNADELYKALLQMPWETIIQG